MPASDIHLGGVYDLYMGQQVQTIPVQIVGAYISYIPEQHKAWICKSDGKEFPIHHASRFKYRIR